MKSVFTHKRTWWGILALLSATALIRGGAIAWRWDHLRRDPDAYRLIAENLLQRGVYSRSNLDQSAQPTAFRPPLYPLALAGVGCGGRVSPSGIATLHIFLGVLTVSLVLTLGRRWQLGRSRWLAAALVACDPILLNQASEVMTESLATCLAVAGLFALTHAETNGSRRAWILAGLVLGLATLCRPTFLVWAVMIAGWLVVSRLRSGGAHATIALALGILVSVAPWVVRNSRALGHTVLATTHGGYTLLLGNNSYFYDHLRRQPWGQVWDARQLLPLVNEQLRSAKANAVDGNPEVAVDRSLYRIAWQSIWQEPHSFAWACVVRVGRLWGPLPHRLQADESPGAAALRWIVGTWYVAIYGLVVAGIWRLGRAIWGTPWIWILLLVAAFTAIHTVYWSNLRMRAPLMPGVYLVAAATFGRRPRLEE